jgi:hypothetical protein
MPGRSDGDADLGTGAGHADGEEEGACCGEDLLLHLLFSLELLPVRMRIRGGKLWWQSIFGERLSAMPLRRGR